MQFKGRTISKKVEEFDLDVDLEKIRVLSAAPPGQGGEVIPQDQAGAQQADLRTEEGEGQDEGEQQIRPDWLPELQEEEEEEDEELQEERHVRPVRKRRAILQTRRTGIQPERKAQPQS